MNYELKMRKERGIIIFTTIQAARIQSAGVRIQNSDS